MRITTSILDNKKVLIEYDLDDENNEEGKQAIKTPSANDGVIV